MVVKKDGRRERFDRQKILSGLLRACEKRPVPTLSLPMPMPADEALTPPLEPSGQSLREAGEGVAASLSPVATSARRAFDLFLREIPPLPPEAKTGL